MFHVHGVLPYHRDPSPHPKPSSEHLLRSSTNNKWGQIRHLQSQNVSGNMMIYLASRKCPEKLLASMRILHHSHEFDFILLLESENNHRPKSTHLAAAKGKYP